MREIGRPLRESVRYGLNARVSRGMRESWQVYLGLKRRCWTTDWSNPQCKTRMIKIVAWKMLSSRDSQTKICSRWPHEKFTERPTVRICGSLTKNKAVGEKRFPRKNDAQWVAAGVRKNVLNRLDIHSPRSQKSMKYVIVMCFHHNTCCLSYVRSRAILSFSEI